MLVEGYSAKDLNSQIYKVKEMINSPKIKVTELMYINDPAKGDLITDFEMIIEVSLKHNVNILTKNKLREQDMEELKDKEEKHKKDNCNRQQRGMGIR